MITFLAIGTAYCVACALWSLTEKRERDEIRERLAKLRRKP